MTASGALGELSTCSTGMDIEVVTPSTPGPHPLLIYLPGTWENQDNSPLGMTIVQYAATQDFVAAYVKYRNNTLAHFCDPNKGSWMKAQCAFGQTGHSALDFLCESAAGARDATDHCSAGIVTVGMSQGGYMAAFARNYDTRVRGTWAMGIVDRYWDGTDQLCLDHQPGPIGSHDRRLLDNSRLRVIRGANDWTGLTRWIGLIDQSLLWLDKPTRADRLNAITGANCEYNVADGCLNGPNGSGWYLVPSAETQDPGVVHGQVDEALDPAGHCFQIDPPLNGSGKKVDCVDLSYTYSTSHQDMDPVFVETDPAKTFPGGMFQNVQWLNEIRLLGNQP